MKVFFVGKLIAGIVGFAMAGFFGLLIGLFIGHLFDNGLSRAFQMAAPEGLRRIQEAFFATTFQLSGFVAKADGRISEQEIAHTEEVFRQFGLDQEQRKRAIELFQEGATVDFDPDVAIRTFLQAAGAQRQLIQTLLLFLISLAHADGNVQTAEHSALSRIASSLGLGAAQLDALLKMAQAQGQFHGNGANYQSAGSQDSIAAAYQALGIESTVSDKELKRAYRRLMSEHHPDKLIAKGVPEEMIKGATERSQDIQAAYEVIRQHRGLNK